MHCSVVQVEHPLPRNEVRPFLPKRFQELLQGPSDKIRIHNGVLMNVICVVYQTRAVEKGKNHLFHAASDDLSLHGAWCAPFGHCLDFSFIVQQYGLLIHHDDLAQKTPALVLNHLHECRQSLQSSVYLVLR